MYNYNMQNKLMEMNKKIQEMQSEKKFFEILWPAMKNQTTYHGHYYSIKKSPDQISSWERYEKNNTTKIPFTHYGNKNDTNYVYNSKWTKKPALIMDDISPIIKEVDTYYIGRNDKKAIMFTGIERDSSAMEKFKELWSQKQFNQFRDMFNLSKDTYKDDLAIWNNYTLEDFKDIIDVLGKEQSKIIFSSPKSGDIVINGFAGTGKTVVANEIVWRDNENHNILALYATNNTRNKAIGFFESIGLEFIDAHTYDEMKEKYFSNVKQLIIQYKPYIDFSKKMLFDIKTGKLPLVFDFPFETSGNLYINITRYILTKKISVDHEEAYIAIENMIKLNDELNHGKWVKNLLSSKGYRAYLFDELPSFIEDPLINEFLLNSSGKRVFAFDKNQSDNILKLEKPKIYDINIIYRTSIEIFSFASKFANIDKDKFISNISSKDSLKFSKKPINEKRFKISEYIKDTNSIIGNEYLALSMDADVPPEINKNLYILFTRAIRQLNIYGKYAQQYKEFTND